MRKIVWVILGVVVIAALVLGGEYLFSTKNIAQAPSPVPASHADWKTYQNNDYGLKMSYPATTSLEVLSPDSTFWWNESTSTGSVLLALSVPQSFEEKTNFGDARLQIGASKDPVALNECLKSRYAEPMGTQRIGGTVFQIFQSTDAAAGNRYETTSYRTIHNGACVVLEETIHYGVLENYDPSMGVSAFDSARVTNFLNEVLDTFQFNS